MNKKEILEIKRNYSKDTDNFTLNKLIVALSDGSGEIKCQRVVPGFLLTDYENSVYKEILKKVLNTTIGSKFTEYTFPNTAYVEDGAQNVLYTLMRDGATESAVDNYLNRYSEFPVDNSSYAIITAHCTYTIFHKDTSDNDNEYDTEDFKFLLTAYCPIISGYDSLAVEIDAGEVHSEIPKTTYISNKPTGGFLYPAFNHRSSDINSIMIFDSKGDINVSLVEDFLECESRMPAETEKQAFNQLLVRLSEDNITYALLMDVFSAISENLEQRKWESDVPTVTCKELYNIIEQALSGHIEPESLSKFELVYGQLFGESNVMLTNIAETKFTIKFENFTMTVDLDEMPNIIPAFSALTQHVLDRTYQINDFVNVKK